MTTININEPLRVFTTPRDYYRFVQNLELDSFEDEAIQRNGKLWYKRTLIAMFKKQPNF